MLRGSGFQAPGGSEFYIKRDRKNICANKSKINNLCFLLRKSLDTLSRCSVVAVDYSVRSRLYYCWGVLYSQYGGGG